MLAREMFKHAGGTLRIRVGSAIDVDRLADVSIDRRRQVAMIRDQVYSLARGTKETTSSGGRKKWERYVGSRNAGARQIQEAA